MIYSLGMETQQIAVSSPGTCGLLVPSMLGTLKARVQVSKISENIYCHWPSVKLKKQEQSPHLAFPRTLVAYELVASMLVASKAVLAAAMVLAALIGKCAIANS